MDDLYWNLIHALVIHFLPVIRLQSAVKHVKALPFFYISLLMFWRIIAIGKAQKENFPFYQDKLFLNK